MPPKEPITLRNRASRLLGAIRLWEERCSGGKHKEQVGSRVKGKVELFQHGILPKVPLTKGRRSYCISNWKKQENSDCCMSKQNIQNLPRLEGLPLFTFNSIKRNFLLQPFIRETSLSPARFFCSLHASPIPPCFFQNTRSRNGHLCLCNISNNNNCYNNTTATISHAKWRAAGGTEGTGYGWDRPRDGGSRALLVRAVTTNRGQLISSSLVTISRKSQGKKKKQTNTKRNHSGHAAV